MSSSIHNIVIFIEPNDDAHVTPYKISNLFMNRFAVEEDACHEILNIFEFEKTLSWKMWVPENPEYNDFESQREHKEINDLDTIDNGAKAIVRQKYEGFTPHFIYCGEFYSWQDESIGNLKKKVLMKMRKYHIPASILTILKMERWCLVTKETVKDAYKGKLLNDRAWSRQNQSVNDDLEAFVETINNGEKIQTEATRSFYTPKLTKDEMRLVEEGNKDFLQKFFFPSPDVNAEEFAKSDSKSKYVHGDCGRHTFFLTLKSTEIDESKFISRKRKLSEIQALSSI